MCNCIKEENKALAAEITRLERKLAKANVESRKRADARGALPCGSSRARVTTANARWMRAAEERDRIQAELDAARAKCTSVG